MRGRVRDSFRCREVRVEVLRQLVRLMEPPMRSCRREFPCLGRDRQRQTRQAEGKAEMPADGCVCTQYFRLYKYFTKPRPDIA